MLTINQPVDYMVWGFMIFMRGVDIMRAIGRVGMKVEPVLGPKQARLSTLGNKRVQVSCTAAPPPQPGGGGGTRPT